VQFAVQSLTTGGPPVPADPNALRGSVTLSLNIGTNMLGPEGGHVELRGNGRLLATRAVSWADARVLEEYVFIPAALQFDTRALPDGHQILGVLLVAGAAPSTSCPRAIVSDASLAVTVNNE
jgi:hypothetical protein